MASNDDPRLPLTSGTTSILKYTEMRIDRQPVAIEMNSTPRLRNQQSLKMNENELRRMPTRQRRAAKKTLMANVGYRLAKRKQLHIHR